MNRTFGPFVRTAFATTVFGTMVGTTYGVLGAKTDYDKNIRELRRTNPAAATILDRASNRYDVSYFASSEAARAAVKNTRDGKLAKPAIDSVINEWRLPKAWLKAFSPSTMKKFVEYVGIGAGKLYEPIIKFSKYVNR